MENQEILDELSNDSIEDETLEEGNEEEETTPNKNKNKSNFNNLYKKAKELESSLSERDRLLAEKEAELEEWRNLNPEVDREIKTNKNSEALALKVF
jgi:hypothetical protein